LEKESYGTLFEQARLFGHEGVSWPDEYDPTEQRAIEMENGTRWYILLFLLYYYDIDYEQFVRGTGITFDSDE